ncbi:putative monooxygenase [Hypoxylon sp. FL1284]|nr:putative monooxygenase [Hypoxylon sp. FL1284]
MAVENTKPHIIILGAGLGGLTLAQSLRKQDIPFQIYERDTDPESRGAGWAIGLHTVLDDLVSSVSDDLPPLRESVHHLAPLNLESQIGIYANNTRFVVQNTPETPVIRANRFRFREWLSTKVPIQWGKRAMTVEEDGDQVRVRFEDGTTASGDILVGADGVNSIVREHVLQRPNSETLKPFPVRIVTGELTLSGKLFENQLSLGHSCWVKRGPEGSGFFLFCGLNQANPDGNSGSYYWFVATQDLDVEKTMNWNLSTPQVEKLKHAIKTTSMLESKFTEIIKLTPASGIHPHSTIIRDALIEDLPVSRITLLGDAIHPMTPFRGEGGIHAIRDALNLGKGLGQLHSNDAHEIESLLSSYQKEMLERGIPAVQASRMQGFVNTNTPNTAQAKTIAWGHEAKPTPEEIVSLEKCQA